LIKGEDLRCDICDNIVLQVLASGQTGDDIARRDRRNVRAAEVGDFLYAQPLDTRIPHLHIIIEE
jgi:hypothetical protein